MSETHPHGSGHGSAADPRRAESRTALRDNLESIAVAILLVLVVRQMVVEAFKIPTGSMAPTLVGVHKEVVCPNCGWVFRVGHDKLNRSGQARCPNCLYEWRGAWDFYYGSRGPERIVFRAPAWLWHEGRAEGGHVVKGTDAANRISRWGSARCRECGWQGEIGPGEPEVCARCGSRSLSLVRKNYIKRLVGMPGEEVTLRNGDVYVDGSIARKPPGVQKRMWMHVFDSAYAPRSAVRGVPFPWEFGPTRSRWSYDEEDGSLALSAYDLDEPAVARFARPINDFYAYNAGRTTSLSGPGSSGLHEVGDCRLELWLSVQRFRPGGRHGLELRITEDEHEFALFVPAGADGEAVLGDGPEVLARSSVQGLRPGRKVKLVLENYDDLVVAKLGGKTLLRHEYEGDPVPARRRKAVAFGAAGADVLFHRVRIQYYVDMNPSPWEPLVYRLDDESYFVLGDNSPASSDSRVWKDESGRHAPGVPRDYLMGEAFAVFWPIHDLGLLSAGSR